jgi:hypothetical protein
MSLEVDHEKRRISMTATKALSGAALSKATAQMLLSDPRTASYDFVLDVRQSPTGSTLADFQIVLEAYRTIPRTPGLKYGCFVSLDSGYHYWARSMGELFGDRICPVFSAPEAAHAFLDLKRGAQP